MSPRDWQPGIREYPQRTSRQNRALHKLFSLLAQELNDAGLDQRKVLKESVDIPWTEGAVKEQLFRPIMKAQLGKNSTTELTTKEVDEVFDTLNRHLGEKLHIHTMFPSIEAILLEKEKHA